MTFNTEESVQTVVTDESGLFGVPYLTLQHATFGKLSRLVSVTVGSLVLGSASSIGALPSGLTGLKGYLAAIAVGLVVPYIGVKIGRKTLSPSLNRTRIAALFGLLHLLYVGAILICVNFLRGTVEFRTILENGGQIAALVSILTLGYLTTINRTTTLQREEKEFLEGVRELADNMEYCWGSDSLDREKALEIKRDVEKLKEYNPVSDFSDAEKLEKSIKNIQDALDQDSHAVDIVTGSATRESLSGTLRQKANKYGSAKEVLERCRM